MGTNERLFYNKFKYRIRFFLRRGVSLLRTCYKYQDADDLLSTLAERQSFAREHSAASIWSSGLKNLWELDNSEVDRLLNIYLFREQFDPYGKVRVESPRIDFYTNTMDYVKRAEDTGIENIEICESLTDEPNIIVTDKLPYGIYNLKCITKYTWVNNDVIEALLNYQDAGEIKFPWTWDTRQIYLRGTNDKPLPEYIYALNEESIPMVNLIAGPVINTVYSYRIE